MEQHLVGSLHQIHIHALWARSFRDNRCNTERDNPCHMGSVANTMGQMSNDVAELNNHQEHDVLRHMEEQPIHINNDSRDRQSICKAIAS